MAVQARQYVIQFLLNPEDGWTEFFRAAERTEAEHVWAGVMEVGLVKPARLIEVEFVEVLRSFPGAAAAAPTPGAA